MDINGVFVDMMLEKFLCPPQEALRRCLSLQYGYEYMLTVLYFAYFSTRDPFCDQQKFLNSARRLPLKEITERLSVIYTSMNFEEANAFINDKVSKCPFRLSSAKQFDDK